MALSGVEPGIHSLSALFTSIRQPPIAEFGRAFCRSLRGLVGVAYGVRSCCYEQRVLLSRRRNRAEYLACTFRDRIFNRLKVLLPRMSQSLSDHWRIRLISLDARCNFYGWV